MIAIFIIIFTIFLSFLIKWRESDVPNSELFHQQQWLLDHQQQPSSATSGTSER